MVVVQQSWLSDRALVVKAKLRALSSFLSQLPTLFPLFSLIRSIFLWTEDALKPSLYILPGRQLETTK